MNNFNFKAEKAAKDFTSNLDKEKEVLLSKKETVKGSPVQGIKQSELNPSLFYGFVKENEKWDKYFWNRFGKCTNKNRPDLNLL
jgi:hypothetical protein